MPEPGVATGILRPPVSAPINSGDRSDYGPRDTRGLAAGASKFHPGVDYTLPTGTPIRAADGGRVIFAGRAGTAGNVTVIDHGNGMVTRYLHQSRIGVKVGDPVAQGQVIGQVGSTGIGGSHLHFELRKGGTTAFRRDGQSVDPEFLLNHPYAGATPGVIGRGAARGTSASPSQTVPNQPAPNPSTPNPSTPAAADGLLRNGATGPQVTEMQGKLKALGYDLGTSGPNRDGVDGQFGDATQRAVQAFQRDRNLPEGQQQGAYGPISRREMADAERTGWRAPTAQQPTQPTDQTTTPAGKTTPTTPTETTTPTTPGQTARGIDTAGPFAAASVGSLVGPTVAAGRSTSLGALNATQSYALGRAVFGDGPGAAALQRIDERLGTGSGVFVQRMVALGQHEGGLNFGRTNADPTSGSNRGTFQVGGKGTTPEGTRARYDAFVTQGMRIAEGYGVPRADPATLSQADRDIFAHIGHMADRGNYRAFGHDREGLLRQMADPSIRGAELAELVHYKVQGGEPGIGTDVVNMTRRENGLRVDLAAVTARGNEPAATRREPAMPVLDRSLRNSYSPAVAQWQAILKAEGQPIGADRPNGIFNSATEASTRALQARDGLGVDGKVGPATWARYAAVGGREVEGATTPGATTPGATTPGQTTTDPTTPESGHSGITRTLRDGDTGPEVSILQNHLHTLGYPLGTTGPERDGVDGTFGPRTEAAVRKYQTDNGLPVTGVVDRATRGQLPVRVSGSDSPEPETTAPATTPGSTTPRPTDPVSGDGASTPEPSAPTLPGQTVPLKETPGSTAPGTTQPASPTSGDGAATVPPASPRPTTPGKTTPDATTPDATTPGATTPGETGPGTTAPVASQPHPDAGTFLRDADQAVSNLLDRHTADVPGTLAALIRDTRGPGSGDLGRTTAEDVQQSFARATAGSAALPLSKTEAGLIAGVLDERSRLVGEGATPAPPVSSGDGASQEPAAPTKTTEPAKSTTEPAKSTTEPAKTPAQTRQPTGPEM